ncbi:pre-mRNA processing 8 protein homolog PRP8 [Trichomonas vaginalis G3]|uniref:Pre-mRNA processing 8 protein homolog PRP8 n=1 Tax=Trichomonas vaginalis (strain ATCC PRA-98 / G3) TaxID=412133 RepID=A2EY65_TRIV3|nr:pre-mRNA processing protein 8 (Prp8) [Trichomonas vaginalis G3]EAY02411.1 pre-mRNA processing 8 protein homolog PRP8 [Trichomonas vaginalis G3]KAI5535530.1 pre-mRNA processing protein 8 (Prp8) [Trichomonas vaginalis G3]|eukprot:XP_001330664.1 pre-mRNA processing 8 protein homolog PRP8 [Trichomonas vaginalis G3]
METGDTGVLQERIAQWKHLRKKHFKLEKIKTTSKGPSAKELPPGHIRQIMTSHGNMSHDKFAGQKRLYIGALKYAPHAVLKFLENMPMPWEELRKVRVLYHTAGALTFVNEVPRVVPPQYLAQWAETWIAMRREKRDRHQIRRLRFPPFDDEEQPLDFVTNIEGVEPPEAILMELDEDEDAAVYEWFYDYLGLPSQYINGLSYRKWKLPLTVMSTLYRLARPLVDQYEDPNSKYLIDLPSLFTSKALNEVIPGGPRFEPLFTDVDPNQEWTEFNDINKIIIRTPISTEWKIAYPNLYNNRPRKISIAPYHYPLSCFAKYNTIITPVFQLAPNLSSISRPRANNNPEQASEEDLQPFTVNCDPLFNDLDHESEEKQFKIFDTLSLFWAPSPFNCRTGNTQRAQDVPLIRPWYTQRAPWKQPVKVRVSYQKLLKNYVLNRSHHRKQYVVRRRKTITKIFKTTPYFQSTTLDWVEAGLQVVQQGYNMCNLLIKRHRLVFLHLDYNFNLKPIKTLNTKERRKSRFGNAYHLMREFFRFTKLLLDCHIQYRLGQIDAYVLADALQYVFSHAGHLTGMYRYKYKLMHQVRTCKDLKHVLYSRFNTGEVGKGPGVGFWGPMWRVWVFFMRGSIPLMERWLGSRVAREYEGRFSKRLPSTVTKQRVESNYDIELRASVLHDITDTMPEGIRNAKAHTVLAHMSEAWRCWKANIPWKVPGLPPPLEAIILRYVKAKADWWTKNAHYARERIARDGTVDKAITRKNTGRLTRLYLKQQSDYQANYLKEGPYITPEQGVAMLTTMQNWLEMRQFTPIPFPPMQYKHDTKMLILALENMRFGHDVSMRMNQTLREELGLIENAHDNPHEALIRIKRDFMTARAFREVKFTFLEHYTRVIPNYEIYALEKMTDAYLDQYLWYEADRRHLFPPWVQPSDLIPPPVLVHKWCERINSLVDAWNTEDGQTMVLVETSLEKFYEQIDLTFLNYMLRLVVDHNLADYMTSKNNVKISFKDMSYLNGVGLIHGLQFTSFIAQYMGLLVDLLILGLRRANEMCGPPSMPNSLFQFASIEDEIRHPIRMYQRYATRIHILYKFNAEQARDLIRDYCDVNSNNNDEMLGYNNKTCWPKDARMRLIKHDVNLGRAVFWDLQNRLPRSLCEVNWNSSENSASGFHQSFASVYSKDNPNLLFYMCGFEVRILPKIRLEREDFTPQEGTWVLQNEITHETTAFVFLRVSEKSITYFRNRVRTILLSSQATTFMKVSNKWNTAIIALVVYFREALVATPELIDEIVKCENRVQTRVKLGLNSKMPNRFPPVVFYAPKEFGGLGLISMGHVLIPQSDLRYATQTMAETTHFRDGMDHPEENFIPALYRYVQSWEGEIEDSKRVWQHYTNMRKEAGALNKKITIEDLDSLWDRGIPRINVLFQRDRHTLAYDKGWRTRLYFKKYSLFKTNPYAWTHHHHDGKLWNLKDYRADVIQALGGVEGILSHSIFKATGYKHWEGLFWDNTTGFEEALKYRKLTNAQRQGMSQVPNRRYTLWWSPTINRANVYVGFQVQLDLTGIFMHGKIPSLKVSLIQLFRGHMWQKTHESIVMDVMQVLDSHLSQLQIDYITKETIHPRKSYKMNSSCADLIMISQNKWPSTEPCFVNETKTFHGEFLTTRFWVDIQLRWGDYDMHDIERYTRSLFYAYTSGTQSMYPSSTGIIIGVDLCYNEWTAFGTWIPGLQELIDKAMKHVLQFNPSISVLRERVKKSLQLYTSEIPEPALNSTNFGELFGNKITWIVEDKHVYRVKIQKTFEGNYTTSPVNGGVFIMNPATGQLFLKIITTKAWQQQKRLQQLAKWKAAEETCALVRTLPPEEQPKQVICTSELLLDPVQSYLSEFPNTVVKGSDMDLPLPAFMKIPKIAEEVIHAPEPKMVLYNLYDDWLDTVSPHAAFRRLMLILRALLMERMKAWDILRPSANVVTQQNHLWPTHSADEWAEVEIRLKDLVIDIYCQRNNVSANSLTQSEIRDIILGVKIAAPSEERQQMAKEVEEEDKAALKTVTTATRDADGNQHIIQTFSQYEQQQFKSKSDWRSRALTSRGLVMRANTLMIPPPVVKPKLELIIPENIYRRFVEISDPYMQICGFLFGVKMNDTLQVISIVIPPQNGDRDEIDFKQILPNHDFLDGASPIGFIHTRVGENSSLEPSDAKVLASLCKKNPKIDSDNFANVVISFPVGGCIMAASTLSREGFEWAETNIGMDNPKDFDDNFAKVLGISITNEINGWMMAPENGIWNYSFNSLRLQSVPDNYPISVQNPKTFFDMYHRVQHFTSFKREMNGEELSIDVDNNFI